MSLTYELVVARYKEDVSWLNTVSPKWKIVIYNKTNTEIKLTHPNYRVYRLGNIGREAETYAFHMKKYHGSYADLTVFIQANPFDHAPEMKELLNLLVERPTFSAHERFIPMTIRYHDKFPQPHLITPLMNRFFHVEDMSVYTLDCIKHIDNIGPPWITSQWYQQFNGKTGTNIMKHFFDMIERPQLLERDQLLIKFHYAACFAITKDGLMQYNQDFYNALYKSTIVKPIMPYILERAWLHIFNRNFDAALTLPEYSLSAE